MTLKILYATAETCPTYRPDVRVLFGEALPRQGVQVDWLALADPTSRESRQWSAGECFVRPVRGRLGMAWADFCQQLELFRRCRMGYDALIVRDKPILGMVGWLAARLARIPFCYWMSYPLPENYLWLARQPGRGRVRRLYWAVRGGLGWLSLRALLVPHSDWLFVQTEAMRQSLQGRGLNHDRVLAVPMGVDPDAVPPPAESLPAALRGKRLGVYLGTLDRYRRPELMVDAAVLIARRHPDFCLLVIGEADDPREHGWLRDYAERVGATPWVYFTGRVPYREGLALARHAAVGLSPVPRTALTEVGSPTKAIEYLACGLPVVCNDQPDQAWVVGQSGGGLLASFDAAGFAEAVTTLLDEPAAARARGAAGQAWVRAHRGYPALAAAVARCLRERVRRGPRDDDAVRSRS